MNSRKSRLVASTMFRAIAPALTFLVAAATVGAAAAQAQPPVQTVGEVIVTAQKTAQNVQNVPISVTAVTAQALQQKGINDVAKLSNLAPNVQLDAGTPFSGSDTVLAAFIRGIGQNDFAFNQDPGVGVYIDGVYLARSVGSNTGMLDVDRVEILKGPQGTLFGRNTIGGAISIITRDPGHEFMFRSEVTTGQFARMDVQATADLPISDKILTSVTFSEKHRNGWQHRVPFPGVTAGSSGIPDCDALAAGTPCPVVYDATSQFPAAGYKSSDRPGGQQQWSTRAKVMLLLTDSLKVTFTGDYQSVDQPASPTSMLAVDVTSDPPNQLGNLYNTCIGLPAGVITAIGLGTACNSPRLDVRPVPSPVSPLPAIGSVNADGNPNNNRLPYDARFINPNINKTYETGNSFSKLKNWGVANTIDLRIGDNNSLKLISAYRQLHWDTGMDLDGSPVSILEPSFDMTQHEWSEELQLTGKALDDRLNYALGAYHFHEAGHLHDWVIFPGGLLMIDGPNDLATRAEALYANVNFKLTDQFSLTAGGRYTWERKQFEGHQTDGNGLNYKASGCYPPTAFIFSPTADCQQVLGFPSAAEPYRFYPPGINHLNFNNFSPKLGIEFHPTMDVMIYGSWSKGFKTGSWTTRLSKPHPVYFDLGPNQSSLQFGPEHATSEEVGIKSELFGRRLRLNLAGFHTDYSGIQLNEQVGLSPTLVNAGNARIWGGEAEAEAILGGGLSLQANIGYTDAKYTSINPGVADAGVVITTAMKLPKTPKVKFFLGPQYVFDFSGGGALQFNLDYTHTSELFNDLGNNPLLKRPATDNLNLSATYRAPMGHWELTVGGTNLTNQRYIVTGQVQPAVSATYGTFSDPAEWYATVRFRY